MSGRLLLSALLLSAGRAVSAVTPLGVLNIPVCSTVQSLLESCLAKAPATDLSKIGPFYHSCLCSPSPAQFDGPAASCASSVYSLQGQNPDGRIPQYCAGGGQGLPGLPTGGVVGGGSSGGQGTGSASSVHLISSSSSSSSSQPANTGMSSSSASPGASASSPGAASSRVPASSTAMSTSGMTTSDVGSTATGVSSPTSTSSTGGATAVRAQPASGVPTEWFVVKLVSFLAAIVLV